MSSFSHLLETATVIINPYRFSGLTDPGTANLLAHWPLQEYSGASDTTTRVDATGNGYDLTDNNTTPSATGQVGNCADFAAANSEYLSIADASWSTHNTSTSWSFWVNPKDAAPLSGAQVLLSKYNTSNQRSWSIYYPIAGNIRINLSELGTAADVSLNGTEILTDNI